MVFFWQIRDLSLLYIHTHTCVSSRWFLLCAPQFSIMRSYPMPVLHDHYNVKSRDQFERMYLNCNWIGFMFTDPKFWPPTFPVKGLFVWLGYVAQLGKWSMRHGVIVWWYMRIDTATGTKVKRKIDLWETKKFDSVGLAFVTYNLASSWRDNQIA